MVPRWQVVGTMLNLFRAQCYKLVHIPLFPVIVVLWLAATIGIPLTFLEWPADGTFCMVLGAWFSVNSYIIDFAVFFPLLFENGLKDGSARNLMVGRRSRVDWSVSILATAALFSSCMIFASMAVLGVYGYLVVDAPTAFSWVQAAAWGLACSLAMTVVAALAVLGAAWPGAAPVVMAVVVLTVAPELTYQLCVSLAQALPPAVGSLLLDDVFPVTLVGLYGNLMRGVPVEPWWIVDLVVVTAVLGFALVHAMRRKELK